MKPSSPFFISRSFRACLFSLGFTVVGLPLGSAIRVFAAPQTAAPTTPSGSHHETRHYTRDGAPVAPAAAGAGEAGGNVTLKVGDAAPEIRTQTHDGKTFDLASRKGSWTVLYFYPKAETPGCTQQACAFRDSIKKIRALQADVFGISGDDQSAISKFHAHHHLNFTLLADPDLSAIRRYGTKMPMLGMSKRWTFVIGPDLTIWSIDQNVDPVKDADRVADQLSVMQRSPKS